MYQAFVQAPSIVIQYCNPPRDTGQDFSEFVEPVSNSESPLRQKFV